MAINYYGNDSILTEVETEKSGLNSREKQFERDWHETQQMERG